MKLTDVPIRPQSYFVLHQHMSFSFSLILLEKLDEDLKGGHETVQCKIEITLRHQQIALMKSATELCGIV